MDKLPLFIKTSDKETADVLIKENYNLITFANNMWTFENKKTALAFDNRKIAYSNMLTF